ncbi:glycosyltransferase family protein [Algoriphagus litoralis]|uniref:glycosyltransferase family 1 protein n=1 Tax=Algoriphagus litoralis TaxID=2202829 RepID=UPI000DBA9DDA|nr:glycosyltransferase family 1 protein [Algoriphagus litoralis]
MSQFQAKKVPVLIASTLKPVNDVRAFGKLGLSIGETNTYSLFIIGFSAKRPISFPGFRFFSSMSHFGSRFDRMLSQVRFVCRLIQVKPKLVISCTYEYLPLASLLKPFLKYKLVYDVQENYLLNLNLNPELSLSKKRKAASIIEKAESVTGIDLYLFAENCYAAEMPEKKPFLILENKFSGNLKPVLPRSFSDKKVIRFCIIGTITPAFGILDAVNWFTEILSYFPDFELVIAGHCPLISFREKLHEIAKNNPKISLSIDQNPVLHEEFIQVLTSSDFALLPYQDHQAIRDKMPTKLFECAALGIPVLISPNPKWEKFLADFSGGYPIDFLNLPMAIEDLQTALGQTFFTATPSESILWKTEKLHFQQAIQDLLS